MCYPNVAASLGSKYNQTFPLGQNNHHTTLRVESNQSRRRPTSWSLFKLLNSGLYAKPLSRGRTLPLAPPETIGPIVGKFREKVESLSIKLSLFLPLFFFHRIHFGLVREHVYPKSLDTSLSTCLLTHFSSH